MKPALGSIAAALSLFLCVAVAVEWARSSYCVEDFSFDRYLAKIDGWSAYDRRSILPLHGEITCVHSLMLRDPRFDDGFSTGLRHRKNELVNTSYYSHVVPSDGGFAGFGWHHLEEKNRLTNYSATGLRFPLWAPVLLASLLPIRFLFVLTRRFKRRLGGRCGQCGYDLCASPDRCPECGTCIAPGN